MNTKFGTNIFNKMLLNAAKFQDYSFYRFSVIKGKPTGGMKLPPFPPRTQIRVKFRKEQNNGEWLIDWTFSVLTFLADSCILFEIDIV